MKRTGLTHFAFGYPRAGNDEATFHDCSFPEPVEGNNALNADNDEATFHDCSFPEPVEGNNALNCVSPRGEG